MALRNLNDRPDNGGSGEPLFCLPSHEKLNQKLGPRLPKVRATTGSEGALSPNVNRNRDAIDLPQRFKG